MDYMYFEDLAVGDAIDSEPYLVTEADIIAYASVFDPQPMHTDPEAAKGITGGLIASGWHTASITMRLFILSRKTEIAPGSVGLGVEALNWYRPVRPGDTLRLRAQVTAARPSGSRQEIGIITSHLTTTNQHGEVVLVLTTSATISRRPVEAATA